LQNVVVVIHLLAATIWVGGTVALTFAGVPAITVLTGEARGRALRELGRRWRPLGYGALLVLAVTGADLAHHDLGHARSPFRAVLWVKIALSVCLVVASYFHNFVLGPRLQSEIRAGLPPRSRPALVAVGWTSLALTLVIPVLGSVLADLA
jgi:uncharacterized membrane protein